MENKKIDFVAHESDIYILEKCNKRLFVENVILIIVLALIIGGILVYSMLPSESIEAIQDVTEVENSNITNVDK